MLNGLDVAVHSVGIETAACCTWCGIGVDDGQHLGSGALDSQGIGVHRKEVRLIRGPVLTVCGFNGDVLLHHVQANISGVVSLGGKNLRRGLEIISGEERGCACISADAGVFKRPRERQKLRLAAESDTQCIEIDGWFSYGYSAESGVQEFHVQHFVVKNFHCDVRNARVGEGNFRAAGSGAGPTRDGRTQSGAGNRYAVKLSFKIFQVQCEIEDVCFRNGLRLGVGAGGIIGATLYYSTCGDSRAGEPDVFYKIASSERSFLTDQI